MYCWMLCDYVSLIKIDKQTAFLFNAAVSRSPLSFPSFHSVILTPSLHYAVFTHFLREKRAIVLCFFGMKLSELRVIFLLCFN